MGTAHEDLRGMPGNCLSANEILAYLDGGLPAAARAAAEAHIDGCRLCCDAVAGVLALPRRGDYAEGVLALSGRVRVLSASVVRPRRGWTGLAWAPSLAVAASVALAVGAGLYLARPSPGESLFASHFEPYPSTRPVVRGPAVTDAASRALARYEAGDFPAAIAGLDEILEGEPNEPAALFYSGLSLLATNQPQRAAERLERMLAQGDAELRPAAEWYVALAHLQMNDLGGARTRLARIAAGSGFYREKAGGLIAELDRLPR